jgi:hypothetical protein
MHLAAELNLWVAILLSNELVLMFNKQGPYNFRKRCLDIYFDHVNINSWFHPFCFSINIPSLMSSQFYTVKIEKCTVHCTKTCARTLRALFPKNKNAWAS